MDISTYIESVLNGIAWNTNGINISLLSSISIISTGHKLCPYDKKLDIEQKKINFFVKVDVEFFAMCISRTKRDMTN